MKAFRFLFIFILLLQSNVLLAYSGLDFVENKSQWPDNVDFAVDFAGGKLFLEQDRFTYSLVELPEHCAGHQHEAEEVKQVYGHAFQVVFEGARSASVNAGVDVQSHYKNYFLGADESKWASRAACYGGVYYKELYAGIDLEVYNSGANLKYDLRLKPGADASQIALRYQGAEGLYLSDGDLMVQTSIGPLWELEPYAYQLVNGVEVEINSAYRMDGNLVTFALGDYDASRELIIDPTVVFATYSGSASDDWGSSATYDSGGNGYIAGVNFSVGYPATFGAFQIDFGGDTDIAISKFNGNGEIIFGTYLGGSGADTPRAIVADAEDNLILLGATSSEDYPITIGALQPTFLGGTNIMVVGIEYTNGTDMCVSKISRDGADLLASTYFGGSGNDGCNTSVTLNNDYGDAARGDVATSSTGDILIASSTYSVDLPTLPSAHQSEPGGQQDGLMARFSSDLTELYWCSYVGGSGDDVLYSVKQHPENLDYYFLGNTVGGLNIEAGFNSSYTGGADGFLQRLNISGSSPSGIYLSSPGTSNDLAYLFDFDSVGNVYAMGLSRGEYPVVGDAWIQEGEQQFIHALTANMDSTVFSTVFGDIEMLNLVPSAFGIDREDNIYLSAWGGSLQTIGGGLEGLYTSPDAFRDSSDGDDFYFLWLSPMAEQVEYATFYGSDSFGTEHVDGGMNRINKDGVLFQSVCSCGGIAMPVTLCAASQQINSTNCNQYLVKFDFRDNASSGSGIDPPEVYCLNDSLVEATFVFPQTEEGLVYTVTVGDNTYETTDSLTLTYSAFENITLDNVEAENFACGFSYDFGLIECEEPVGIEQENDESLSLRIAAGQLLIEQPVEGQLRIFDNLGRLVLSRKLLSGQQSVALPDLATGLYHVRLKSFAGIVGQTVFVESGK